VEVPEDVKVGLANIRPTLHARWNPLAKVVGERSYDANGMPRQLDHDPRWEVWDTDESGREYRVAMLEAPDGTFLPLGAWVLKLMHDINPANYDGDMHRMIQHLVDQPNEDVGRVSDQSYEDLLEYLADLCWSRETSGSRIAVPQPLVR